MPLPEHIANSPTPGTPEVPITALGEAINTTTETSIWVGAPAPAALQAAGQFRILVDGEIMLVTGGSNTTNWTVVRGNNLDPPDNCSPSTHVIGTDVFHKLTAGALEARYAHVGTDGRAGGPSGTPLTGAIVTAGSSGGIPAWVSGIAYPINALVTTGGLDYICTTAHTSGSSFSAPESGYWQMFGGGGGNGSGGVTSFNGRQNVVVSASGDYTAAQVTNAADKSSASQQTFTGVIAGPLLSVSGSTGATSGGRYVGSTVSGHPTSGSFFVGDWVTDHVGARWTCTAAGTPGTWTQEPGTTAAVVNNEWHPEDYGAKGDVIREGSATIAGGALSTVVSSTVSFTAGDVGKSIFITGAGAGGLGLNSTISGYTDAHHVTISPAASTAVSNVLAIYGTDDTAAIQTCINTAAAVGRVPTIRLGPCEYLVNGAPQTDLLGNSIIRLPAMGSIKIIGTGYDQKGNKPKLGDEFSTTLTTTRGTDTYNSATGAPSVLGGPLLANFAPGTLPTSLICEIRDLAVMVPANPRIAGIDLGGFDGSITHNVSVQAEGAKESVYFGATPTPPTNKWAFGIRYGASGGIMTIEGCFAMGMYVGAVWSSGHAQANGWLSMCCVVGIGLQTGGHAMALTYVMTEGVNYHLAGWDETNGAKSLPANNPVYFLSCNWDMEDYAGAFATTYHILDANNQFYGDVKYHRWGGLAVTEGLTVLGGVNLSFRSTLTHPMSIWTGTHATRVSWTPRSQHLFLDNDTRVLYQGVTDYGIWSPVHGHGIVTKVTDQAVTNATFVNDSYLKFPIDASERWYFRLVLDMTAASTTANLKLQWVLPTGGAVKWQILSAEDSRGVGGVQYPLITGVESVQLCNGNCMVQLSGWITADSTHPGTAQLQWAQNTLTVETVTMNHGSFLELIQAGAT